MTDPRELITHLVYEIDKMTEQDKFISFGLAIARHNAKHYLGDVQPDAGSIGCTLCLTASQND
jgi:hypothetical protein